MLLKNITQKHIQKVRLIQPHNLLQLNHQYCFHPENLDRTAKIVHILYPLSRRIMTYICIMDLTNSNSKNVIGIVFNSQFRSKGRCRPERSPCNPDGKDDPQIGSAHSPQPCSSHPVAARNTINSHEASTVKRDKGTFPLRNREKGRGN